MPDEAGTSGATSLKDAIDEVTLSSWSDAQLSAFLRTLQDTPPPVTDFFKYIIWYIEYNRSRYLGLKYDLIQVRSEFASPKREVKNAINTSQSFSIPHVTAPAGVTSMPNVAAPTASGATTPDPMKSILVNAEGTFSGKMGHVSLQQRWTGTGKTRVNFPDG